MFSSTFEQSGRLNLIPVHFFNGSVHYRIPIESIQLIPCSLLLCFLSLGLILPLLFLSFHDHTDLSEVELVEVSCVGKALAEGFCEIVLEVATVDLVVLVIATDCLAPVPCQLLLVCVETASAI